MSEVCVIIFDFTSLICLFHLHVHVGGSLGALYCIEPGRLHPIQSWNGCLLYALICNVTNISLSLIMTHQFKHERRSLCVPMACIIHLPREEPSGSICTCMPFHSSHDRRADIMFELSKWPKLCKSTGKRWYFMVSLGGTSETNVESCAQISGNKNPPNCNF